MPGQQAIPPPRHPPAKSGHGVERLRDRRQFAEGHLQVAHIGTARATHLREFPDQIPLHRGHRLGHVVHLALDARRLVRLHPHRLADGIPKDAHGSVPPDTQPLPEEGDHGDQRNADGGCDPLVLVPLDRARDADDDRLVDVVETDVEIDLRLLELPADQSLGGAVHRGPRWWW